MTDEQLLSAAVKQAIFEIFDEEMIAQIDSCLRRIVAEELKKNK